MEMSVLRCALTLGCLSLLICALGAAGQRDALLKQARAHWRLADAGKGAAVPLAPAGKIEYDLPAEGEGALRGARVARLTDAYFNAGADLGVTGHGITVYLRVRDPRGLWAYGLFNKRGNHSVVNFNLFSVDLGPAPGPDIGFELHSEAGFVLVSFPVSDINPTAWHDLVGRYDGKTIELICDGRIMAKRSWHGGDLTQNTEPVIIGAETDNGRVVRPFTGEMEEAALWSRTLTDAEVAQLARKEKIMPDANYAEPYDSPIHYRPATARLADTIPFFWQGEYHIFYLRAIEKVPWEHIVSTDLVHWRELPTALVSDGAPDGPDGCHMFTGSVIERQGTFHIFYTGHNPANPKGLEFVMHATSPDLIHWTKHPEDMVAPDGLHYKNHHGRDFRDPMVLWNEEEGRYWMVFFAKDEKTGGQVQGVAVSKDLTAWEQVDHLEGVPGQECPDLFQIGDTWYLLGGSMYRWAKTPRGPYAEAQSPVLDSPAIYAAKRMFDGKRHIWTGWVWDRVPETDSGAMQWGGTQCLPREIYAGPAGQLYARPAPEVTAVFGKTVLDLAGKPDLAGARPQWRWEGGHLVGENAGGSQCVFDVPDNYMLEAGLRLDPAAQLTLVMREQPHTAEGYRLVLRPRKMEAEINGPGFAWPRRIGLDATKPIKIQAFVQGTIIETFINDQYAFSCRAYNYRAGKLGLNISGGKAQVTSLTVKVP
jgi:beta-fructofuranosidase